MTFVESSEIVFATTPPQPASNARAITRPLVPGGPDPRTNGFLNFSPLTSIARLGFGINDSLWSDGFLHRRKTIFENFDRFLHLGRRHVERRRDAHDVALEAAAS